MHLDIIVLDEIRQTEKDKWHVFSHLETVFELHTRSWRQSGCWREREKFDSLNKKDKFLEKHNLTKLKEGIFEFEYICVYWANKIITDNIPKLKAVDLYSLDLILPRI